MHLDRILVRLLATAIVGGLLIVGPTVEAPPAAAAVNLAAGRPATASSFTDVYRPANVTDGSQATYWESANGAFPQWVQVDLGSAISVDRLVLKLPNGWPGRTQTLAVQGSANGSTFTSIKASATYTFDPTATIDVSATTVRYVRLHITANTGWPAGQISELEVYGPDGGNEDTNLAVGKPIVASSHVHTYVATNANDNNVSTYWEGGAYPGLLTVQLGAGADVSRLVLRLNPDPIWGPRTQTIQVLGREQGAEEVTNLVSAADYRFDPADGNSVTIPIGATVADIRLRITANTGAPGGQVAELQVFGTPAPNPDLEISALTASPANPTETDPVRLTATVRNTGNANAGRTSTNFYLDGTKVGTAEVPALAAGATTTVSADTGPHVAGSHPLNAKVDEANDVVELDDTNNSFDSPEPLVVRPVDSSDLIASPVSWSPSSPAAGDTVEFSVALKNQGTIASASGGHGITLTLLNESGGTVTTLTGSHNGAIAPGATTAPVRLGTWTAANGTYTARVVVAADANELPVKRENNTSTHALFVGRGATMPYDRYEAEDGVVGGGAARVGPNRTVGDLAGEASGRRAVTLDSNGAFVEFTTRARTNTLVTRFSIPDAPGGGGMSSTLNIYVDGTFLKAIDLTSRYSWVYGNEAQPTNTPGPGPRHIYDEANVMLGTTVPAGSRIRLQKDPANTTTYAIDFVDLEQVSPIANPDPARYAVPAGRGHQDVQNALDRARQDTSLLGVYLPAGDYQTTGKFQVYGRPVRIVGAGPWYTRFLAPAGQENTDIGFRAESSANGSTFTGFAYFGNYVTRIDGPGKVFDFQNVSGMVIDNVWAEHLVCLYWGTNTDNGTIRNSRVRNLWADAINMTNGSSNNHVVNIEARTTGDDSFALFAATDAGGGAQTGNVYENLTSITTWRAAGVAVYGGYGNTFRNISIADTLVYSGVTISSLDFGIPMDGFGADPPTRFENISIVRSGGHFWGAQTFPAMWLFSASKAFQGIRVSNVDIVDPTYHGIMFQTKYSGGRPENPVTDTVFTDISISGAQKSGDAYDEKSGFGIWANELPEPGQGSAVGSVTFHDLRMSNNHTDIRNVTSTFQINLAQSP